MTDVFQPDFIDINFGCPVKKVVKRNGGSGCLKDLDLVQQVIRAVAPGTHLPVTVKIRSGWSEEMRDPVGDRAALPGRGRAGAHAAPAHAHADVHRARALGRDRRRRRRRSTFPVIGNGDIKTAADALRMREHTGCAGVMIGRGSFGQPWIFAQARALLDGTPMPPDAADRGALRDRARPRAHGAGVRARPARAPRSSSASTSAGT